MKTKKPFICIITGPCGAGKSTISKKLAKETKNSVYIDVDSLRDIVENGYADPTKYTKEAKKQIDLSMENAIALTINFIKKGFNVFIDDCLERNSQIKGYPEKLKKYNPNIFLLLPNKKTILKRDSKRRKNKVMGKRALELHDIFTKKVNRKNWHILDTSNHSVKQTKNEIMKIIKKVR
ncbi:AAA family ATPase [bacterium]|nr:AAA family ATPase [bacterium]